MLNIAHKNKSLTVYEFLNKSLNNEYIDGINIDVVMTRDERVVYFTSVNTTITEISQIQENNYSTIKQEQFLTLKELLEYIKDSEKSILINILSVYNLNEYNLKEINRKNKQFIANILKDIELYSNKKFYLYSENNAIVKLLQSIKIKRKNIVMGLSVSEQNLNFQDVDFYVIKPNMISQEIIDVLFNREKEVMVNLIDNNDFIITLDSITPHKLEMLKSKYKSLYLINRYPEILNKVLGI